MFATINNATINYTISSNGSINFINVSTIAQEEAIDALVDAKCASREWGEEYGFVFDRKQRARHDAERAAWEEESWREWRALADVVDAA